MYGPRRRLRWIMRWRFSTNRSASCSPVRFAFVTTNARAPESRMGCCSRGLRRMRSSFSRNEPVRRDLRDPDLVLDELFCCRVPLRERLKDEAFRSMGVRDYVPAEAPIQEELGTRLSRSASSAHGGGLP